MPRVRPAVDADLPALTEIYNHYVVNTAITFDVSPFEPEQRRQWFAEHATTGRHRLIVVEAEGRVLGYASTSRFRPKPAYDTTVESSVGRKFDRYWDVAWFERPLTL